MRSCSLSLLLLSSCASEAPPSPETEAASPAADPPPPPCAPDPSVVAATEAGADALREHEPSSVALLVLRVEDGCEVAAVGMVDVVLNPGSALKPLVMAAALTDGLDPAAKHGDLSMTDVLVRSSNEGMAPAYAELGEDGLRRWSEGLGWEGDVRDHTISALPRDVARGYLALVDGGDATFTSDAASRVREMLKAAVGHDGTGRRASAAPVPVAGKTGTSLMASEDEPEDTRVTFVGWSPADDPQYVVFVSAARPQGRPYAGAVAAPAFAAVIEALYAR